MSEKKQKCSICAREIDALSAEPKWNVVEHEGLPAFGGPYKTLETTIHGKNLDTGNICHYDISIPFEKPEMTELWKDNMIKRTRKEMTKEGVTPL